MKWDDINAFFALLRAGLWERWGDNANLSIDYDEVDWGEVYRLAEEQSVVGLVAAGIDRFKTLYPILKCPQEWALQFVGSSLQLEQSNKSMNQYLARLVGEMRKADIYALLIKGQGLAQCYERPLWRANGDIDLFLSDENYKKAKNFLHPLASTVESEATYEKHLGMTLNGWVVELHGRLLCGLSGRSDKVLEKIQDDVFFGGDVRSWNNQGVPVFMLSVENDVFYVFTHYLGHFYKGGIGLRQICDWCRLLWTYKDTIKTDKLRSYIKSSGLESEWKAFGAFAVEYLGMPVSAVPMVNENDNHKEKLKRKAERIKDFILMSGNFGHNRDMSFYSKYPFLIRKFYSLKMRMGDLINHARIFPLDSLRFFLKIMIDGLRSVSRGE